MNLKIILINLLILTNSFQSTITAAELRLIAPEKAPVGSPIMVSAENIPEGSAKIWRRFPVHSSDVWFELYDSSGKPVNIFWSSDQGLRTIELIVAQNGPSIEIASCTVQYGDSPTPVPVPVPLPIKTPSPELQKAVEPLVNFVKINISDKTHLMSLAEFYYDFSEVVRRDSNSNIIKDTSIFRKTYVNAGSLMFQQANVNYANLATVIDNILVGALGLDVVPLNHAQAADILNAVAWAFYKEIVP